MSTIQQLSHIASQLPDAYQQDLLAYAHNMLNELSGTVNLDEEQKREQKLQRLILDRYVAYKQSGQKGRPLDEVMREIKAANGLQ